MYQLLKRLFPITRSITGNGVRETLRILREYVPLTIKEVPSGTKVFDWVVPDEWNIRDAYVKDENGKRIIDFQKSNLHLVSYSVPFEGRLSLNELKEHLHTLPDQPDVIPYVTSYYAKRWGFCLTHNQYKNLQDQIYEVKIDSSLMAGYLTYGELIIEGQTDQEVLLSTYICHPSMANNELSGPVVTTHLAKHLLEKKTKPYFTYRIIFVPETIGSITYLSLNKEHLKEHVMAGYVITSIGDPGPFSYLQTRAKNTLVDRVTMHVLQHSKKEYVLYEFWQSSSDERQYNSPGIDLPVGSLMRTKYGCYPEYHTSADNLDFVTPQALADSLEMYIRCLDVLENNHKYVATVLCEPQLGKRGLYPTLSKKTSYSSFRSMKNLISYCDGALDLVSIAEKIKCPVSQLFPIVEKLVEHNLLRKI